MERLNVQIDEEGQISIEASGFSGKACLQATEELLEALKEAGIDADIADFRAKPEMRKEMETITHRNPVRAR